MRLKQGCANHQEQMPAPTAESSTITYQVPRDVLIRIWWQRMMCRPSRAVSLGFLAILGICCVIARGEDVLFVYVGIALLAFTFLAPIRIYLALAKAIDANAQFTDRKVMEFGPAQLLTSGPNWKSELPWSRFLGFSEDANYFFLHLSKNGIATVIPKAAFTPDQMEKFSAYAKAGTRSSSR
jgi:hypothetical protein